MMPFVDSLLRWARLAGIVGLAAGSLAVQACTRAAPGGEDASADAAQPQDAALDASARDAALDASARDATSPQDAELPDARLWDVICE